MRADQTLRRARAGGDGGFTLTELLITMVLFGIVGTAASAAVISMMRSGQEAQQRAQAMAQAQLGVSQMARQVRSGNVLNEPVLNASNWSLLIYTQANGVNHCVRWQAYFADDGFNKAGTLTSTSWQPGNPSGAVTTPVASGLDVSSSPGNPPFWLDPAVGYGNRLLEVNFVVVTGNDPSDRDQLTTSIAARNTQYDYPVGVC